MKPLARRAQGRSSTTTSLRGGNSLLDCVVYARVAGAACAKYVWGDGVKVTSLAALAGGGKGEGSKKKVARPSLLAVVKRWERGVQMLRRHITPVINAGYSGPSCYFLPRRLRISVDAAVALVGVVTLWTGPPCSLALLFSVTAAMR